MKFNIHSASVTKFIVASGSVELDEDCAFPAFIRMAYKNDTISTKDKRTSMRFGQVQ